MKLRVILLSLGDTYVYFSGLHLSPISHSRFHVNF
jgi:hypothetical protein